MDGVVVKKPTVSLLRCGWSGGCRFCGRLQMGEVGDGTGC